MPEKQQENINESRDELGFYIKTTRPGSWLLLALVFAVLAMFLIWMLLGTMKTTVSLTGIKHGAHFTGYLRPRDVISINPGQQVELDGKPVGIITDRGTESLSAEAVIAQIDNAYYTEQITLNENNVLVKADMEPDAGEDGPITLTIVLAQTRPFDFFMK